MNAAETQKCKTDISIKAIVLFLETHFCLCLNACSLQCFHYIMSFVEAGLILDWVFLNSQGFAFTLVLLLYNNGNVNSC